MGRPGSSDQSYISQFTTHFPEAHQVLPRGLERLLELTTCFLYHPAPRLPRELPRRHTRTLLGACACARSRCAYASYSWKELDESVLDMAAPAGGPSIE